MIDVLLHYYTGTRVATLAQIVTELQPIGLASPDGLDASRCCVVELETQSAVWDYTNPNAPVLKTPRVIETGVAVWCAVEAAQADALWALAGNVARLKGDRATGTVLASRADPTTMAKTKIIPSFAGSRYLFGG